MDPVNNTDPAKPQLSPVKMTGDQNAGAPAKVDPSQKDTVAGAEKQSVSKGGGIPSPSIHSPPTNLIDLSYLKSNGLLATIIALLDLAINEAEIKQESSKHWSKQIEMWTEMGKEVAHLEKLSKQLEALKHTTEGEAQRNAATIHFATGVAQGVLLGAMVGSSMRGTRRAKGKSVQIGRHRQPGQMGRFRNGVRNFKNKVKSKMGFGNKTQTAKQPTQGVEINRQQAGQQAATAPQGRGAEVRRTDRANEQSWAKGDVKKSKELEISRNRETQTKKGIEDAAMDSHAKQMMFGQVGNIIKSFSDGAIAMNESVKEFKLADIAMHQGEVDALKQLNETLRTIASKGMEQADRERKDAADVMERALQALVSIVEKAYQFGIGVRSA